MNYFSKIKPVLNKLSELNVYDSLEVKHRDRFLFRGKRN